MFDQLPSSLLQLLAIFLSIMIEALPFVLLGAVLSGTIEVFVTPDRVQAWLPRQKVPRILFGTVIGFILPSCECGIVPIVSRLLEKKVPSYTAIPFMATAPVINPVVIFATYSAFGNSWRMVILRVLGAGLVATSLGLLLGFVWTDQIALAAPSQHRHHHHEQQGLPQKIVLALTHAIDDFFEVGPYLVFGALFASTMQIYVPTRWLSGLSQTPFWAILILMAVAFIMSLCSEADAFIGASLLSSFGLAPVMAFLLFGPIIDIKNLLLMTRAFKPRFIGQFIGVSGLVILSYCLLLEVMG